ncbi:nuclear transport factor 2 family protein [Leifsonia sp. NPDC058292]|uniref:nuclear transport factor 2 family protein n=1 Tax=Leifsonia sp. NPDC058292 TaxID=3346428 RepID=UPI0036DC03FD
MANLSREQVPAPVLAAIDAANSGDLDGFLDAFAPNGSVDDWGRVFTGREQVRRWSDAEFIGAHVTLDELSYTTVDGDGHPGEAAAPVAVAVSAQVGGDGFNGPSTFTFAVGPDGIDRMTITG